MRRRLSIALWWTIANGGDAASAGWSWLRGRGLFARCVVAMVVLVGMTTTAVVCGPSWLYWGLFGVLAVVVACALAGFRADERRDTGAAVDQ